MPNIISITGITGSSPYFVYICDSPITTCVYIDTITTIPYNFDVPMIFDGLSILTVKIIDNNGVQGTQVLT